MNVGTIIASHEVTESKKPVGYLYREKPDNETDSGWRVFSGSEGQQYTDDPNNFSIYNASTIIGLDPSIAPLLVADYPVAFERAPSGGFIEITE